MSPRNIKRVSRVIQLRCEELTNIGDEPTSKTEVSTVPDSQFPAALRFDVFEIDLQAGELRRDGRRVRVQEQPFRVLSFLVQRAGQLVTREEFRERLWPADTFVDFDHGLNSAVARLREALGDAADKPRFVETIAKRGYRFVAPLQSVGQAEKATNVESGSLAPASSSPLKARLFVSLTLGLVCASVAALIYPKTASPAQGKIEVVPLIALHGFQATPAFSPNGMLVAFRQSDGKGKTGIYTAVVGGEKTVQLTSDPDDCCPTWSPDSRQIAFSRYSDRVHSIVTVPALGGTEHRLYRGPDTMGGGLSWSPDGKYVAFVASPSGDRTRSSILFLSLADYNTHEVTSPPPGYLDRSPAFSPDGKRLAFIRSTIAGVSNDIYVMSLNGGTLKRLTFDNRPIMGSPAWTADSGEIVFSSDRGVATGLWRVSATGCIPVPVAGPVGEAMWPSIPTNGKNALVYEQGDFKTNIWRLNLRDATHHESPLPIVSEKGDKMRPELSPDGKQVAFESNRLGFWDLWTCNLEKGDCSQVTSLHGTAGRARWSPNGHYIAFEFHPNEHSEIYIVEVPGGIPHLLPTIPGADNLSPSWSRDGKWLYFGSKRGTEAFQIWRLPVQGDGNPVQVTRHGGISAVESADGRYLYYSKFEQGGVWRMSIDGRDEEQVLDVGGDDWPNWALTSQGIYFFAFAKFSHPTIQFLDFASGKTHPVLTLERKPGWGLSVTRDGKSLIYTQDEFEQSNLMMVENFK